MAIPLGKFRGLGYYHVFSPFTHLESLINLSNFIHFKFSKSNFSKLFSKTHHCLRLIHIQSYYLALNLSSWYWLCAFFFWWTFVHILFLCHINCHEYHEWIGWSVQDGWELLGSFLYFFKIPHTHCIAHLHSADLHLYLVTFFLVRRGNGILVVGKMLCQFLPLRPLDGSPARITNL